MEERAFGYTSGGAPTLGPDGKYQVTSAKLRFDTIVADDEIDLESGFILLPQAIPQPAPAPIPGAAATAGQPAGSNPPITIPSPVQTPQPGMSASGTPAMQTESKGKTKV